MRRASPCDCRGAGALCGTQAGQHGDLLRPDQDYARFIEENSGKKIPEGNFVTTDGKIVGRHRGITHYTVGQRKGLNLSMGKPVFVLEIRPETNEVVIGDGTEVYADRPICSDLNFMSVPDFPDDFPVVAKIRYNHSGDEGTCPQDR